MIFKKNYFTIKLNYKKHIWIWGCMVYFFFKEVIIRAVLIPSEVIRGYIIIIMWNFWNVHDGFWLTVGSDSCTYITIWLRVDNHELTNK